MSHVPNQGRDSPESLAATKAAIAGLWQSFIAMGQRLLKATAILVMVWFVASYFTREPLPLLVARMYQAALAHPVEAASSFFGVLGTLMLATRGRRAGWGFVAFLASNAGWLWFSHAQGHQWMFMQQVAFSVSSLVGVWVWLVKPAKAEGRDAARRDCRNCKNCSWPRCSCDVTWLGVDPGSTEGDRTAYWSTKEQSGEQ